MRIRLFATALALLLSVTVIPTAAADDPPSTQVEDQAAIVERICAQMTCQQDVRVKLTKGDGSVFDRSYPVMPAIVQGSRFAVLAEQMVFIETDLVDGRLTSLRAVDCVVDAAKTLTARFEQTTDGGMLLELQTRSRSVSEIRHGHHAAGRQRPAPHLELSGGEDEPGVVAVTDLPGGAGQWPRAAEGGRRGIALRVNSDARMLSPVERRAAAGRPPPSARLRTAARRSAHAARG